MNHIETAAMVKLISGVLTDTFLLNASFNTSTSAS